MAKNDNKPTNSEEGRVLWWSPVSLLRIVFQLPTVHGDATCSFFLPSTSHLRTSHAHRDTAVDPCFKGLKQE